VKLFKYMLIGLVMSACVATTGKVTVRHPVKGEHKAAFVGSLLGDLNLVVSSSENPPAGELVVPKTTDLSSVVLLKPVLVLSSRELDGNRCEEE